VYLPPVSTIGAGKFFYIKDICGNAAKSTIYISTQGLDRIEQNFAPSTLYGFLSTNFGSVLLAPDGGTNWMVLQNYTLNAVSRELQGGIPLANMYLWLDAADPTMLFQNSALTTPVTTIGQSIGGWKDKSGNGRNYVNDGSKPSYTTLNTVSFNSGFLSCSTLPAGSKNLDMFIVTKPKPSSSGDWRTLFRGNSTDHHVIIVSGDTQLGAYYNASGFSQYGTLRLDGSARVLLHVSISSTNVQSASLNGNLTMSQAGSTSGNDNIYHLGAYQGGSQFWGDINEIIIYNVNLGDSIKQQIFSYLNAKWSIY
jgi:hypothetical protein